MPRVPIALAGLLGLSAAASADELIPIQTDSTTLLFRVDGKKEIHQLYLGDKAKAPTAVPEKPKEDPACPGGGGIFIGDPAIRACHADGGTSTELVYVSHETKETAPGDTLTRIQLKDGHYPFFVDLCFRAHAKEDVIEQWTEIRHEEDKPVLLQNFTSASLTFRQNELWLTHYHGAWANEMNPVEEKLTPGSKLIDNKYGVMGTQYVGPHFLIGLGGKARENEGTVLAASLAWSGNFVFNFEQMDGGVTRVNAGINPYASERTLAPKESFQTPHLIYTLSTTGKGEAARRFHRWARQFGVRDGAKPQLVINNNWEATGFDFDEKKIIEIMKGSKDLGAEIFLLDDGWFGNGKHARLADNAGLGDWEPNKDRLPNGLKPFTDAGKEAGIQFGIWVEPEMVNVRSDLYEKHPEWVLTAPGRDLHFRRNQLVLDMTRPEVQEHAFNCIDKTLQSAPDTTYVKWDCNRYITQPGSTYLDAGLQSHLWVDYVRGLYKVMDQVAKKYPNVTFMVCSGGGGRVDYGSISRFQQFWPSDNTDPVRRISMQWEYAQFFPATAISAHATHWGKRPLKFVFDVAMSARLGMDLDPRHLSDEDRAIAKQAIELYKTRLRPVVQFGELYRLESPYETKRPSTSYVTADKSQAVVFAWQTGDDSNSPSHPLKLQGLDPAKAYHLEEVNVKPGATSTLEANGKDLTGKQLAEEGLKLPLVKNLESVVILLTAK